ncbi:MAG: hypothetical protein R2720_11205 [Candidatus Nanopelagicales bacterium]
MTISESEQSTIEAQQGPPQVAAVLPPEPLAEFMSGGFPSANLMPPAIVLAREVSKAKKRAGLMLACVFAVLALLVVYIVIQQRAADKAAAQAQVRLDAAVSEKQQYAYVPAVYEAVSTAREELATAMGQEVQVTRLLGGLAAMQPPGLSLNTMAVTAGPATDQTLDSEQTVLPGVGQVAFSGEAQSMQSIADWLERVRDNADYASPILNEVTTTEDDLYGFDAAAELTDQALSGRFVEASQ